jgi:hypothetical protein
MREHNLPREVNGKAFLTRWSASPARWAPRLFAAKAGWCLKNITSPYPLVVHECLSPLPRLLLPKVTLLNISMGRDNTRTLTLGASSSLNTLEVTLDTPFYSSFKAPLRYSKPTQCLLWPLLPSDPRSLKTDSGCRGRFATTCSFACGYAYILCATLRRGLWQNLAVATSVRGPTKMIALSSERAKGGSSISVDFCVGSRGSCMIEGGFVRWMLPLNEYTF